MALETVANLDDLVVTNPTATDPVSEADDHLRNIKIALAKNLSGDDTTTGLKAADIVTLLAKVGAVDITGSALTMFAADATMLIRLLNNGAADVGVELTQAANGFVTIKELDGGGVSGLVWLSLTRGAGVALNFGGATKFETTDKGASATGQVIVSDPAPLNPEELTRKDYVDGLIAGLQSQIDNIENGFAFTGAISAPTVTET